MLDFGWSEFFLIIVLAVFLLGPKDIPTVVYQAGRMVRRLQYMKYGLTKQFDDFMEQNDLQELRRGGGLGDLKGDVRAALQVPMDRGVPLDPIEDEHDEVALHDKEKAAPMEQITLPLQGGGQGGGHERK